MSTDFSIRPAGAPAPAIAVPAARPAASQAVATELSAGRSVTAADGVAPARNDAAAFNPDLSREAFYDRAAGSIVYQIVDQNTAQVVDQYPEEAALRRRAYFRALEMSKDNAPRVMATDRTV